MTNTLDGGIIIDGQVYEFPPDVMAITETEPTFELSDKAGNVILRIENGHIKTRSFDSSKNSGGSEGSGIALLDDRSIKYGNDSNPLGIVNTFVPLAGIFAKWGFIGDSLSSGFPSDDLNGIRWRGNGGRNFWKFSWGQCMCRSLGVEGTNFTHGGETAKHWLNYFPGHIRETYNTDSSLTADFDNDPKTVYCIQLGFNDRSAHEPLGSIAENVHKSLSDYTADDLNTFAGQYSKIILLCKQVAPSSRIFCITTPKLELGNGVEKDGYNGIIREIVNEFDNVFLIDLYRYLPYTPYMYIYGKESCHLYAQGYVYIANAITTYIDYIIRKNPQSFKNVYAIEYLEEDTGQI